MISLAPVLGFSVLGIPSGDTQNTSDLGTGVPKTRGYPNHCDTAITNFKILRELGRGENDVKDSLMQCVCTRLN